MSRLHLKAPIVPFLYITPPSRRRSEHGNKKGMGVPTKVGHGEEEGDETRVTKTRNDAKKSGVASPPFLMTSVACRNGHIPVSRTSREYTISYRIFRPNVLLHETMAPLVILHGGPSLPSNYLYPLVDGIPHRSLIFFDQLGCGRSSRPSDPTAYSIESSVQDLERLIQSLKLGRFHLYGQSYGGILAFEYLKKQTTHTTEGCRCLSAILSSTPSDISRLQEEAAMALDDYPHFYAQHVCRTPQIPAPLLDAYAQVGNVWCGTGAISTYMARPPPPQQQPPPQEIWCAEQKILPNVLILRGEHDFVSEGNCIAWLPILKCNGGILAKSVTYKTLEGCSHHGLLENAELYRKVLIEFLVQSE